jgi:predicted transcriptional regulator
LIWYTYSIALLNEQPAAMSKPRITSQRVIEVIPSDRAFAEKYLQQAIEQENIAAHQQAIHAGITDANAGKLVSLATVKAKWLSR